MRFLASTLAIVALSNIAAAQPMQRFESVEPHMGTLVRVTLYAPDEQSAKDAFRAAFDRITALDEILSDYRPASELNAIARYPKIFLRACTASVSLMIAMPGRIMM